MNKLSTYQSHNLLSGVSTQCSNQEDIFQDINIIDALYYVIELITCYPNKQNPIEQSLFYSQQKPQISLKEYVYRIDKKLEIQENTYIIAFNLFEKFIIENSLKIKELNFHKLYFISIMLATKMHVDDDISMKTYQRVSGIPKKEIILLELEFLKKIKFSLYIKEEKYLKDLNNFISIGKKLKQNELQNLFDVL